MRFRILHLLIITLLVGAAITVIEWASYQTAAIHLSSPEVVIPIGSGVTPSSPDEEIVIPQWG